MLYCGAVEGTGVYVAPKHVYKMSDAQHALCTDAERLAYRSDIMRPGALSRGETWYADNSREPIRDETLRQGLLEYGAAGQRTDLAVTSPLPKYFLKAAFAELFRPELDGEELESAIAAWRADTLSPAALARLRLVLGGALANPDDCVVTLPNSETVRMSAGASSVITRAVVEQFASNFLEQPAVIWISESGNKVITRHDIMARNIGLRFDQQSLLPDVVLADLGGESVLLVFVEVVATDGPITDRRRGELLQLVEESDVPSTNVAFVTAFMDRNASAFRRNIGTLSWNSFAWLASEPSALITLQDGQQPTLLRRLLTNGAPAPLREEEPTNNVG